jgi:hypothetical protein
MKPAVYVPVTQVKKPQGFAFLVVRTSNDPASTIKMVEGAVWSVDQQQPVSYVRTMDQLMETDVADRTRPMVLLGVFAGLALVLACLARGAGLCRGTADPEIGVHGDGSKARRRDKNDPGARDEVECHWIVCGWSAGGRARSTAANAAFGVMLAAPGIYAGPRQRWFWWP